ncbi:MAG: hypothetical protein RR361_00395, partial [Anaerovorax sp.]
NANSGNTTPENTGSTGSHPSDIYFDFVNVIANHGLIETNTAIAGSAGGVSVTPVLALNISGADTQAYIGTAADGSARYVVAGDLNVLANSDVGRAVTADAAAVGGSVAVGGSFGINISNDTNTARLNQSAKAKNVNVKGRHSKRESVTSKAGAQGAGEESGDEGGDPPPPEDGKSDAQADSIIKGGSSLAGSVGSNNIDTNTIENESEDRQKGETSEGTVAVAAGFAMNLSNTMNKAELGGGITVEADDGLTDDGKTNPEFDENGNLIKNGVVSVIAEAKNESIVEANASATESKVGVGVAVAVNSVTFYNIAVVTGANIIADEFMVRATLIQEEAGEETPEAVIEKVESDNWFDKILADLVKDMIGSMGLGALTEDGAIAQKLVDEILKGVSVAAKELLNGTGLEQILEGMDPVTKVKQNFTAFVEGLDKIPSKLTDVLLKQVQPYVDVINAVKDLMNHIVATPERIKGQFEGTVEEWNTFIAQWANLYQTITGLPIFDLFKMTPEEFGYALGDSSLTLLDSLGEDTLKVLEEKGGAVVGELFEESMTDIFSGTMTGEAFGNKIKGSFVKLLMEEGGLVPTLQGNLVATLESNVEKYFSFKELFGTAFKLENFSQENSQKFIDDFKAAFTTNLETTVEDALTKIPGVSSGATFIQSEIDTMTLKVDGVVTKTAIAYEALVNFKTTGVEQIKTDLEGFVKNTADEMVGTLTKDLIDVNKLKDFIKEGMGDKLLGNLKSAASALGLAVTNASLDALVAWTGTALAVEAPINAHHFSTISVAGAGATNVGIAGSVSIGIIKGTTEALVKKPNNNEVYKIQVSGDTIIEALGTQREESLATASTDVNGAPDKNLSAGEGGTSDAGNGSALENSIKEKIGTVTVVAGVAGGLGEATVQSDANNVTIIVSPKYGYQFDENPENTVKYSYTDSEGKVHEKTLEDKEFTFSRENGELTVVLAKSIINQAKGEFKVTITSAFVENTKTVSVTTDVVDKDGKGVAGGLPSGTTLAEVQEAVPIGSNGIVKIYYNKEYKLKSLTYTYNGSAAKKITAKEYSIAVENGTAYVFSMPNADVTVTATFEKLVDQKDQENNKKEKPKDKSGKTVGVGAAFSMVLSDVTANAGIDSSYIVTTGALKVDAGAIHQVESISVSGSDPLAGNGDGEKKTEEEKKAEAEKEKEKGKDISMDASAALNIVNNHVNAFIGEKAKIITTAMDSLFVDADEEEMVNFFLHAWQEGNSLSQASGFAAGESTSVGAAVTVNIVSSHVAARFAGEGIVHGSSKVLAHTYNEDVSKAIATAVGADVQRQLNKFADGIEATEENGNKLLAGDYFKDDKDGGDTDKKEEDQNKDNKTSGEINKTLNDNKTNEQNNGKAEGDKEPSPNATNDKSLSTNVLRSQNVTAEGTDKTKPTTDKGLGEANDQTGGVKDDNKEGDGKDELKGPDSDESKSFQVAAAVGLNITNHKANVEISESLSSKHIEAKADNDGNYRTLGTGAAMSQEKNSNAIAAGVAVSVNNNEATIHVKKGTNLTARGDVEEDNKNDGDVVVEANLTQNMDGKFRGYLGAQALAGAISGAGGKVSIGGAVAVIVSNAKTMVLFEDAATQDTASKIEGGDIRVGAFDKSKLALRAGGISVSKGAAVGIGASFALIYSHNEVKTKLGNYMIINGDSLQVVADKQRVDFSDYESPFGWDMLITDSSQLTEEERERADKGIIDIHKGEDDKSYTVEFNISTDTFLEAMDLLNFLSSTNYYAESVAGSIMGSPKDGSAGAKASIAGAFSMIFFYNTVEATVGDHVAINLKGSDYNTYKDSGSRTWYEQDEKLFTIDEYGVRKDADGIKYEYLTAVKGNETVNSKNYTTYTVGEEKFYIDGGKVYVAETTTDGEGNTTISKMVEQKDLDAGWFGGNNQNQTYTQGMTLYAGDGANVRIIGGGVSAGSSNVGVGLTLGFLLNEDTVLAQVGNNTNINIAKVSSNDTNAPYRQNATGFADVMVITVAMAANTSKDAKGTIGGGLNAIATNNKIESKILNGTSISTDGNLEVGSTSDMNLILVSLSVSGAAKGVAIGGTFGVIVHEGQALNIIGDNVTLESRYGDVHLYAKNKEQLIHILASASGSAQGAGLAGVVSVLVTESKARLVLGNDVTVKAFNDVTLEADSDSWILPISLAIAVSGKSAAIGATVGAEDGAAAAGRCTSKRWALKLRSLSMIRMAFGSTTR